MRFKAQFVQLETVNQRKFRAGTLSIISLWMCRFYSRNRYQYSPFWFALVRTHIELFLQLSQWDPSIPFSKFKVGVRSTIRTRRCWEGLLPVGQCGSFGKRGLFSPWINVYLTAMGLGQCLIAFRKKNFSSLLSLLNWKLKFRRISSVKPFGPKRQGTGKTII